MNRINNYRVMLVKENSALYDTNQIKEPGDAALILGKRLEGESKENFLILTLNTKNRVLGCHTISMGSLTASVVHPREVFQAAILDNAASIILSHNHPSGDPNPSREDILVTERLVRAGKLLDIPVLDHIVIGEGERREFVSMKNKGLM